MAEGTNGRVYGGAPNLVHIEDGQRREVGRRIARFADKAIRDDAAERDTKWGDAYSKPLCPGCFMIALFNAAIWLAEQNGQPLSELGNTMAKAFTKLAADPSSGVTEEIEVILDPEPVTELWGPCSLWPRSKEQQAQDAHYRYAEVA